MVNMFTTRYFVVDAETNDVTPTHQAWLPIHVRTLNRYL
jgi:hypothetical protein